MFFTWSRFGAGSPGCGSWSRPEAFTRVCPAWPRAARSTRISFATWGWPLSSRRWRVALAGAGFPLLHGGLHLAESLHHGPHGGAGELVATVLPGLIALAAVLRLRGTAREGAA